MTWQPMTTAPRDGTVVLVTETPNGEHYNVIPAMYANMGGGDPRMGQHEGSACAAGRGGMT